MQSRNQIHLWLPTPPNRQIHPHQLQAHLKNTMHTISKHYATTTHLIPPEFEQWLESIPVSNRMLVAIAILDQCKPVFSNIPRNHLTVVQLPQIENSAS